MPETLSSTYTADRLTLEELLSRYTRALDHEDLDSLDDVFTPDAVFEVIGEPRPEGQKNSSTLEQIKGNNARLQQRGLTCQHLISNVIITIDGDKATGTAEARTFARLESQDRQTIELSDRVVDYLAEYIRGADGWRISHFRASVRWRELRILPAGSRVS
jgi:ketosteroid isomerase-like protein